MSEKKRFRIHIQADTGFEQAEVHIRNGDLDAARAALSELPSELVEAILRSAAPLVGTTLPQPGSGLPIDPQAEADLRATERRIVLGHTILEEAAQLQALLPDVEITVSLPGEERRGPHRMEVRASIDGGPWRDARVRLAWTAHIDLGEAADLPAHGMPARRPRRMVVLDVPDEITGPVTYTFVTPNGDEISGGGLARLAPPAAGMEYYSRVEGEDPASHDLVAEWRERQS